MPAASAGMTGKSVREVVTFNATWKLVLQGYRLQHELIQ